MSRKLIYPRKNGIVNSMEKRYYSLDRYLKQSLGEKTYKLSLNGGFTCPNRDGTIDTRGCIFCSAGGSGDFASDPLCSIHEQIIQGKNRISRKYTGHSFIAYFQAYTNTYGNIDSLRKLFLETAAEPDIKILSIATRPDCLDAPVLSLLQEINLVKPIWIELGLQTMHDTSAAFIRRGYALSIFEQAVSALRALDISVIVHVILGLPGESKDDMLQTISYLNTQDIMGIKLQLLHVLRGTDLADYYRAHPDFILTREQYLDIITSCIARLRPDIVIHRLTGDGPKELLLAPLYSADKRGILNSIQKRLKDHDIWQGKDYTKPTLKGVSL